MARESEKVVVVGGSTETLEQLEKWLEDGSYDVVFVQSYGFAYTSAKKAKPDYIILCVGLDDPQGLAVLSMLKLDPETRHIPVATFVEEFEEKESQEEDEEDEPEVPLQRPIIRMN